MRWILGFIFFLNLHVVAQTSAPWTNWAKRFTGESDDIKRRAIQQLRKNPRLTEELLHALNGSDRLLALDVIGTLRLTQFIRPLRQLAKSDPSGMVFVTLNSLMTKENQKKLVNFYLGELANTTLVQPSKVVILDTLSRLQISVDRNLLEQFIKNDLSPELQSATLRYLRPTLRRYPNHRDLRLLREALEGSSLQIRMQALYLFSELPPETKRFWNPILNSCQTDKFEPVRALCQKISKGHTI